ncbi:pentatricopeptide repeat-containing protein At1g43980, mitochondrial-like [Actinidia eriantha]|uniref:pentatricopeptide repeat-containing protein At1g43980, mitochondrial-like n=1 Tax=Actinidia eriantha TaxID=165200 RepID=UPI002587E551|nr:pentatricopeptide repeat-containing protein At1g43980, mitochondrial-like [Actinidia eriantha]
MNPFLSKAHSLHTKSLSFYSNLIDHCLSSKSLDFCKLIHAQLVKVGFNTHTFLGNRCIDLYSKVGTVSDALKAFDDIDNKSVISWNICLRVYVKSGNLDSARNLFDEMPERDVVSWNSMMSGYASNGYLGNALEVWGEMRNAGMRPNEFTFSILASSVTSACHGKQIHGSMMRSGVNLSNVIVGNSFIDMYGTLGLMDYALGVFLTMEEVDVISWNSLISGCCKSGHGVLALNQFCLMLFLGYSPDEFTISTMITVCTNLRYLEKGKQFFAFCLKIGFLSNATVSSAAIDLFSKCNRLEDSIKLFEEISISDSVVCNSMISSYARHGFGEDALQLFVFSFRENLRPTEFTISSVLSSASSLLPDEQGTQLHSLVVKLGMESDAVIASSLVEMYAKYGLIDPSMKVFAEIDLKDLISWNTMILGLTQNGRVSETLELFMEMLSKGLQPDRITLVGVLLACSYGCFVDEGMSVFSSMETAYGIIPRDEHYLCVVDMMIRADRLKQAIDIIEGMPREPNPLIWESILRGCGADGDLKLIEIVAERLIEHDTRSSLPYLVLARAYEMRGRWESMVRVSKAMTQSSAKKVSGCSWIGIRNHMFVFKENHLLHNDESDIYSILGLLVWEMGIEGSLYHQYENVITKGDEVN